MFRSVRFQLFLILIVPEIRTQHSFSYPQRSIYNKLTQEEEFEGFVGLINFNKDARMDILEKELTLFIPMNTAFKNHGTPLHSDLAFYHMAVGAHTLQDLRRVQNVSCVRGNFPKLWISRTNESLFVNNAEIIAFQSDYPGRTRNGIDGKDQILHIIDDVLDPLVRNPTFPHTAYNFMAATEKWHLDTNKSVANFFHKVKEHKLTHLYQLEGANTYFMPIDRGIDPYTFKMLNKQAIFGHVIPSYVLFTRPTARGFTYETMANDNDVYMLLSLEEIDGKVCVKGNTVMGTEENPKGEIIAEIIQPNIPVLNGVVHLISQPLGIFRRASKPFPYLPIMEKLSTDPELDTIYEMGENTGFNKIFTTHNVSFTYFVPNDYSWRQIKKKGLHFSGSDVDLLKRHLIISDTPYSMENLLALSSGSNYTHVELKTAGGYLRLLVLQIEGNFYIRWNKTYIKVLRPNYECTDGFIHIIAGPIANLCWF